MYNIYFKTNALADPTDFWHWIAFGFETRAEAEEWVREAKRQAERDTGCAEMYNYLILKEEG